MRRIPRTWNGNLARWTDRRRVNRVGLRGVHRLAFDLRRRGFPVTVKAIYNWIEGVHPPDVRTAEAIVNISRGQLSFEQVFHPYLTRVRGRGATRWAQSSSGPG